MNFLTHTCPWGWLTMIWLVVVGSGVAPCRPGGARPHGDGIAGAVHFARACIASVCVRVHACALRSGTPGILFLLLLL